ncbi:S-layer homology domain-containing protein [Oscillibacter sp. GMB15532]|uniref:S-layer homology domain-containing protein n=1 Tax=Oscillibacter sp. GMB15532 TaxID=3230022 RepID=UPI0034DFFAD1
MRKRLLSILLSVCMVLTLLPVSAMAEEVNTSNGTAGEIIAFAALDETEKNVATGTQIEDLELPESLTATVRTMRTVDSGTAEGNVQDSGNQEGGSVSGNVTVATTGSAIETETIRQQEPSAREWEETTVDIQVTWTAEPEYDGNENGDYIFTPVIEGYTVSADLPEITVTVGAQPRMMALRTGAPADYGDFSVSIEGDGAAPIFNDTSHTLTFDTAGKYTVGMADGKDSTSNTIVVSTSDVTLNLDGVTIRVPAAASATISGANALTVTSDSVALNVIADSSLTGGDGCAGSAGTSGSDGGAGIYGDVVVTGTATLTVTGGRGGTASLGESGDNGRAGFGIKGNVDVSGSATLIAVSGSGDAGMAIISASGSGGGTITAGEGYTVYAGADATSASAMPSDSTFSNALYVKIAPSATKYGIWVGTTEVTSANASNVLGDTYTPTVTYDADTNTLTLNGARITTLQAPPDNGHTSWRGGIFKSSGDLNIALIGDNIVDISDVTGQTQVFGICIFNGALSITGAAGSSLDVTSAPSEGNSYGIWGDNGVTISNCTVTATGGDSTGVAGNTVGGIFMQSYGTLSITNATVTANGGYTAGNSIGISYGTAEISNSTVTATGYTRALQLENLNPAGLVAIASENRTDADAAAVTLNTSVYDLSNSYKYVQISPAPQAQWGIATGASNDQPPGSDAWTSGSLTDAMAYANGLGSGTAYIQLLENVDIAATLEFASSKTTMLDLNGKTLDGSHITSVRDRNVLGVRGNLTLCDSSTNIVSSQGSITGGQGTEDGTGGGVYIGFYGTFTMTGGNITGNTAANGGGITNMGAFNMTGGSIAGNSCILISGLMPCGGGVANEGSFTMSGGSITGNTVAEGGAGGGVFAEGMTLSGNVNISGNTVGAASDNVALMSVGSGIAFIGITEAFTCSTAIGVSLVNINFNTYAVTRQEGVFTEGNTVNNSAYISKFVSDNSGFAVIAQNGQLKLAAAKAIAKEDTSNGSFTVRVNGNEVSSATEGQTVTVTPAASSGYELDTISVYKTGDSDTTVTVTNGSFTMPAYGVTVNVTFRESSVPAYTISGTIKGSDTGAGIPASLQLKDGGGNVLGTTTAANGSYSFTGVPAGSYTVAVSCTGYDSGTITGITVSTANLTGKNLTLTKSISGLTDAQKLAAAKAAIMAAINRMSFSNSTTAADILSVAQAASLYGVTVAWDNTNEFTKTQATTSATGSIRGTFQLVLNQESDSIGIDAAIAKLSTNGDNGGGGSDSGGSTTSPSTKPTEPVTGSTENKATVDNMGNANVGLTDKNITDAIADAKAAAAKKGVNAGDITAVIHVTTGGKDANTVTVNLPKTTQEQVIGNRIASVQLAIDRPDLTIGIDLAAVTEINRQAKADVQLSATRMDNAKLTGDAKTAIGNRPAYDLKTTYGSGKSVTDFGKGSVSVEIPYTLQKGEIAGNVYAVYVDAKGKVTYLTDSSYDAKRGTVVFSTNHFSTYGVAYKASFNFTDIAGHWAKDDILFVANRGLMTGTSATTFNPNGSMTRGMFVTALGRLANADISAYKQSSFTDVKADAYYMGYIEWGVKNNILVGIGGGKFNPDGLVTREQMAVMMDRYATSIGFKLPEVHAQNTFADNTKIGAWAAPSVKRIQMAGIIQGKNNNFYDPQGTATRAEVSAVLRRFVELTVFSDTAQGWVKNDSGQWMFFKNGKALTGWQTINGKVYCFDSIGGAFASGWKQNAKGEWFFLSSDGSAVTGWKDIGASGNSKRYYFDTHGVMIAGKWLQIDGKWYYFYADGSLAKRTKVDGYEVDKNGVRKAK